MSSSQNVNANSVCQLYNHTNITIYNRMTFIDIVEYF